MPALSDDRGFFSHYIKPILLSVLFVGGLVLSRKTIPPNMNQNKTTDISLALQGKSAARGGKGFTCSCSVNTFSD